DAVTRAARPWRSHASSARSAGTPYGTLRSFAPLPNTRTTRRLRSTSARSSPHSSLTRIPVAYSRSSTRRSRTATGSAALAALAREVPGEGVDGVAHRFGEGPVLRVAARVRAAAHRVDRRATRAPRSSRRAVAAASLHHPAPRVFRCEAVAVFAREDEPRL